MCCLQQVHSLTRAASRAIGTGRQVSPALQQPQVTLSPQLQCKVWGGDMSMLSFARLQARGTVCTCVSVGPERRQEPCQWGRGEAICLGHQEGVRTSEGCVEAASAPGWCFFHRRGWVFLYLGQDFCAKICLMNKPGLPSKPVSFHNHFLQTGKQYFVKVHL